MAGISSPGLGSGLDINGLVSQLMAAERAPHQSRITRQEISVTTKVSALGALKGSLSTFMSALAPLKDAGSFQSHKAVSADTDYFSVNASSSATAGHYDIEVLQLAKSHQLSSSAFIDGADHEVGYGTLMLSLGADSFEVTIAEDASTLADIREAINAAVDNPGISATVVNGVSGSRLLLTSTRSGADNAIEVAAAGGDSGLDVLIYDPDGTMNMTELEPAQSALIRISSEIDVESSTNVIDDAIEGVTITLKKAEPGTETALDVSFDINGVMAKVQKFVADFNTMQSQFAKLRAYNPETQVAGPMLGDSLLRGVESQLRRGMSDPVTAATSNFTTLASVGIVSNVSGQLEVDATRLREVIEADPDSIASLFGSSDGVASRLHAYLDDVLDSDGEVDARNTTLQKSLKQIARDKEALVLRMAKIEERYRKQFTALDGLLSSMQSTSSYLAQQLANLPKMG